MAINDVVIKNLATIVAFVIAIGVTLATLQYQGDCLAEVEKKVYIIEKESFKVARIESDISEIKQDLKDIKALILKPKF